MESIESNYLSFFSLNNPPFEEVRNPQFFYHSRDHLEALERLKYALEDGNMNFAMLTGEVGCGKTLTRMVLEEQLPKSQFELCVLENSFYPFDDILYEVLSQVKNAVGDLLIPNKSNMPERGDRYELMNLFKRVAEEIQFKEKRKFSILLDESQHLDLTDLDELKNLTNLSKEGQNLVTIVLVGQPELSEQVRQLKQVEQRVSLRFHLNNLDRNDIEKYIEHRLKVAGHPFGNIVTLDAMESLFRHSLGVPRDINRMCKLALEQAFADSKNEIDSDMIAKVIEDLTSDGQT